MRRDPMFHSVVSGMSQDHVLVSCITREGETGVTVVAVVRDGASIYELDDVRFAAGDTVVLVGPNPALRKGCVLFRREVKSPAVT